MKHEEALARKTPYVNARPLVGDRKKRRLGGLVKRVENRATWPSTLKAIKAAWTAAGGRAAWKASLERTRGTLAHLEAA